MANNNSFFSRLTRLFRSGPSIQRRVKGHDYRSYYDNNIIKGNYGYHALFPFGRETSPFSIFGTYGILDRMARYAEFAEMEWCLHEDTKIAVPHGFKTIKELAEKYGTNNTFIVYAYDHSKKRIVPAIAKHARLTRYDHAFRVVFSNGKEIIGTADHRLLKRDGTYCAIQNLKIGDSLMPFCRNFNDQQKQNFIFVSATDKWITEDELLNTLEENKKNVHSENITFAKILQWCDNNCFDLKKVTKAFDVEEKLIINIIQSKGFSNFYDFARAYNVDISKKALRNVTFQTICNTYNTDNRHLTKKELAKILQCSLRTIDKILKKEGYKSWSEFANTFYDCKVVKIEYYGYIPLYDLTVEGYKNFATDSVISHNTPEIAAALNIFADETVAGDEKGKALHLFSRNSEIKRALEDLFYDILNIDFNLRPWVRNLVKYGDFFLYNEVIPDVGIVNVQPIPVNELEREEGFDSEDPYAVRYKWLNRGMRYLENWQVTHMRILGNDLFLPYGTSLLEPARRVWRQLLMAEDSMLVYRVVRSPERRVFYIDVGNIAPNDVPAYMEAVKQTLKSKDVIDRNSGRIDQRYNPISIGDDYYLPVRGSQTGTKIDTLAGGQNATAVEDVKYLQQKLFAALQVPKPYLNFDENLSAKASLAQQDIRFSRTIAILQRIVIAELNKLAMIHLYSKGFDGEDLINFELRLSNPSTVAMQQKLEAIATKFDIAGTAKETKLVDEEWIQRRILELTDDEIIRIEAGRRKDKIREVELEAVAVAENLPKPNTIVDPFDPSNYNMKGADITKNPPNETAVSMPNINNNVATVTTHASSIEKDNATSNIGNINKAPITPKPFLNKIREKRRRRVGMAGRSNISLPDFASMLSAKNRSLTDVFDKETINLKSSLFEEIELEIKKTPFLPNEMRSIFKKLDVYFENSNGQRKLLKELKEELSTIEFDNDIIISDDNEVKNNIDNDDEENILLELESLTLENNNNEQESNESNSLLDIDLTSLD